MGSEMCIRDRPAVHDAKVALGERGVPWWEAPTDEVTGPIRLTAGEDLPR